MDILALEQSQICPKVLRLLTTKTNTERKQLLMQMVLLKRKAKKNKSCF